VVFAIDRGGIVGADGPTHHGLFDLSYLRSLPNMVVMAPKDENELRRMLRTAVDHDGPIALRYPRGTAIGVAIDGPIAPLKMGRSEILRHGDDVVLMGIGRSVIEAAAAADTLAQQGLEATVVNSRFVKPLDAELLTTLARRIPRIVTVEENVRQGGFGSAVWECLNDAGVHRVAVERVGIADTFVAHGSTDVLRREYGVDADAVVRAALSVCGRADQPAPSHVFRAVS
jgi:1-deoxy-D-xylulose-5-phosphate synthase